MAVNQSFDPSDMFLARDTVLRALARKRSRARRTGRSRAARVIIGPGEDGSRNDTRIEAYDASNSEPIRAK
jgi:hypothetical protein